MKILLLKGGDSPEREVSLWSAENMYKALLSAGYDVEEYDPSTSAKTLEEATQGVDAVFLVMHGKGGEDGEIQIRLEKIGVPYLGADSESSRESFDKVVTHRKLESIGVVMPRYEVISSSNFKDSTLLKSPFVAKPVRGGSSIDTTVSRDSSSLKLKEVEELLSKHGEILVEELIVGQEITVPILGQDALPPILTIPPDGEEFDYENKYNGKTQEIVPIPAQFMSEVIQEEAKKIALSVHKQMNVRDLSRVDCMIDKDGAIYVLEINTLPGLTTESFFPKAAKAVGLEAHQLADRLVQLILSRSK